jgi:hypothetical protein
MATCASVTMRSASRVSPGMKRLRSQRSVLDVDTEAERTRHEGCDHHPRWGQAQLRAPGIHEQAIAVIDAGQRRKESSQLACMRVACFQ